MKLYFLSAKVIYKRGLSMLIILFNYRNSKYIDEISTNKRELKTSADNGSKKVD